LHTEAWDTDAFTQKSHCKILCTAKLAQSTSPSTTLYYKACTQHFVVLLCATKLAQSTFQYYFVQQRLHKALPISTLCTTKLARPRMGCTCPCFTRRAFQPWRKKFTKTGKTRQPSMIDQIRPQGKHPEFPMAPLNPNNHIYIP
jgi:hypothetical protein